MSLHAPLQPPNPTLSAMYIQGADNDESLKFNEEERCKHHGTTVDEYNVVMLLGPNRAQMLDEDKYATNMYSAHFLARPIHTTISKRTLGTRKITWQVSITRKSCCCVGFEGW